MDLYNFMCQYTFATKAYLILYQLLKMTEVSFARQFLSALDSKPGKLSGDHVESPRNYPSRGAVSTSKCRKNSMYDNKERTHADYDKVYSAKDAQADAKETKTRSWATTVTHSNTQITTKSTSRYLTLLSSTQHISVVLKRSNRSTNIDTNCENTSVVPEKTSS